MRTSMVRRHPRRLPTEIIAAALAGVVAFTLVALLGTAARSHVPPALLGAALLVPVFVIARFAGILFALPVGVVTVLAFDWYFLLPLRILDGATVLVLGLFLTMSVLVGALATHSARRAVASEAARGALAGEQAALRRVATLVAHQSSPPGVFAAVAEEVGRLLRLDAAYVQVYAGSNTAAIVGAWSAGAPLMPVGTEFPLEQDTMSALALDTGRSVRIDDYSQAKGAAAEYACSLGIRSAIGAPILVEGRPWGLIIATSLRQEPIPPGTGHRMGAFTELVATAIANAEAHQTLERLAREQAAHSRLATLVAQGDPPEQVYAAAIAEVPALFGVPVSALFRYDTNRSVTVVAASADLAQHLGRRWTFPADEPSVIATVLRTGRPSQLDRDGRLGPGADGQPTRQFGIDAALGMPIVANGRVWGVFTMGAADNAPDLPADAGDRLRPFTDLLATATGNTEAWSEVRRLVDEQTALRRVATLVARGAEPPDVFTTVAEELGRVLEVDVACVVRYEPDATATVVAAYGDDAPWPVGSTLPLDGAGIAEQVFRTRRPLRSGGFEGAAGALATVVREGRGAPGAGAPIMIGDRLWGAAVATSASAALPTAAERCIGSFADLIATAITNAETRAELNASRARVVAASDETRRKLEQDLHDGIQQRLVTLAIRARVTSASTSDVPPEVRKELSQLGDDLVVALDELRETARGIHPAILTEAGLGPALKALARRSTVPVRLDVTLDARLEKALEVALYYVASEALTNAVKHARATAIDVGLNCRNGTACLSVRDDGVGGVDPTGGFGLLGLKDRVEALAGHLTIVSPPGNGTTVVARLPTTVDAGLAVGRLS